MTDKVQKIREEVARKLEVMQYQIHRKDAYKELKSILNYMDSLQEEPVSKDLEEAAKEYSGKSSHPLNNAFKAGAEWQREKDESTTEDLGKYINELSKQFPEVSFAKLSRIAVRVAKWKEEQDKKKEL